MSCISIGTSFVFFFFNDTATTEIYTLSLHDALPICETEETRRQLTNLINSTNDKAVAVSGVTSRALSGIRADRKSTRLNSSHDQISYAVFCLKKKKKKKTTKKYDECERKDDRVCRRN